DSGVGTGTVVGGHFDPLLAKAVAWGETREEAVDRLDALLARTVVLGVETNATFLRGLLAAPDVRAGNLDTGLIDRLVAGAEGSGAESAAGWVELVAAALFVAEHGVVARPDGGTGGNRMVGRAAGDDDPWRAGDGWRLNGPAAARRVVLVDAAGAAHEVRVTGTARDAVVQVPAPHDDGWEPTASEHPVREVRAALTADPAGADAWWLTVDGVREGVRLALDEPTAADEPATVWLWLWHDGRTVALAAPDRSAQAARARAERRRARGDAPGATDPEVRAAMPGTVVTAVADGDPVTAGSVLVTVEAM